MRQTWLVIVMVSVWGACVVTDKDAGRDTPQQESATSRSVGGDLASKTVDGQNEISAASVEALLGPADFAPPCQGSSTCPPEFNNCIFLGDFDCGDEFCRTPGEQCGGQPSTFIRVGHVEACFDPAGHRCDKVTQGRRLVHCGC